MSIKKTINEDKKATIIEKTIHKKKRLLDSELLLVIIIGEL